MKKLIRLRDRHDIKIHVSDNIELPTESTRILTEEGYLKATAAVTKVGVQMYSARDFGIDSDEPIGVLRPFETVFHEETISSLKMKPIVLLHPEQDVDSTNHSRLSIGSVGENVGPIDNERLGASIQITDKNVVEKILSREIEELSLGYDVFIISEEGNFNGEYYLYKMDGPMLNNHLAIVPDGRCGDTVKILDQGGSTVNKKQMVKALRDAGVSEDKIKLFMASAKDEDTGDFKEYSKLLLSGKDIDMGAIIPALVAELKPAMEEMAKSPEFTSMLAKEIAAGMVGAGAGAPAPGDAEGEGEEEETPTPEMVDAAIKDGAKKRAVLIAKATPFTGKDEAFKIHDATEREILEKALTAVGMKAEDFKGVSDDYLTGVLDSISTDRKEAAKFSNQDFSDKSGAHLTRPLTGITGRKALK